MTALLVAAALATSSMPVVHGADGLAKLIHESGSTPLVLHFFATWCPECVKELPHDAKLFQEAKSRGARVVLLSLDDPKDAAKALRMLADDQVPGDARLLDAPDPAPIAALMDRGWDGGLPATFVYRGGAQKLAVVGPVDDPKAFLAALAK